MSLATRTAAAPAAAAFAFALATAPLAAQTIDVHVADYRQAWRGAGVALAADLSLLDGLGAGVRAEVFRRGAGDLALGYLYDRPAEHPDEAPAYFARRLGYVRAIRAEAPGAAVVLGLEHFPASLRRDTMIDGRRARRLDTRRAGIYGEVAAWYHAVLAAYAEAGVPVAMISLATAPDRDAERQGVHAYGTDPDARVDVARLYHLAVDSLRARLADPARNPDGLELPLVLAPNASGPVPSADYLNFMRGRRNAAWLNVGAVGFQQVGDDGSSPTAIGGLRTIAATRPLLVTQALANRGDKISTFDALDVGHRAALSLAATFTTAVAAGAESYAYDRIAVADPDDETGLLAVGGGAVETPRRYAAFRQLTATQARGARRVAHDVGAAFGLKVAAFRREGADTVVVHVANYNSSRTVTLNLSESAGGPAYPTLLAEHLVTDGTRAADAVALQVPDSAEAAHAFAVDLPGFSVNTFTFALPPAPDTSSGGGTDTTGAGGGGVDTTGTTGVDDLHPDAALAVTRVGDRLEVAARGDEPLRDVRLLDLQGRLAARAGDAAPGTPASLPLVDLPHGVYVVTAVGDGRRFAQRIVW